MSPEKALFKIFKCKKQGETLEFFFLPPSILSIVGFLAIGTAEVDYAFTYSLCPLPLILSVPPTSLLLD
jgi:hypothetical protein